MRLTEIRTDSIDPSPHQPRVDSGDITDLTASIAVLGITQPVVVVERGDRFELVAGHRRTEAARDLGLEHVPAIVAADDGAALLAARTLAENMVRRDLTDHEKATAVQTVLSLGMAETEAARAVGVDPALVARYRAVASVNVPEAARPTISLDELEGIAEFAGTETEALLLRKVGEVGFDHVLTQARSARQRDERAAATAAGLRAAGATIIGGDYGYYWTDEAARAIDTSKSSSLQRLGIDPEDHADCPGHAARIELFSGRIDYFCLAPGVYHPESAPAAEDPAEAARRREEQDRNLAETSAALAAADVVRNAFIARLLADTKTVGVLVAWAADALAPTENDAYTRYLELSDPAGFLTIEGVEYTPAARLLAMILPDVTARATYSGQAVLIDHEIIKAAEFLRQLISMGYEPSEVEQAALDAYDAETVAMEAEEAGDDA